MIVRATAVAVTGLALATAAPAAAHVGVKSYSPKRGSTVSRSLERVAVTFKGRITDGKLTVRGGNGNKVSIGSGSVAGGKRTIRVRLRDGLAKGRYKATFIVKQTAAYEMTRSWNFNLN